MGCTYVIECLSRSLETNSASDADLLKHCPNPADPRYDAFKGRVIYVWNDPLLAIFSHARRGWLWDQCFKLGGQFQSACNLDTLWRACIEANSDVSGILSHAERWLKGCRTPLFFLDLRQIGVQTAQLSRFLGLSVGALELQERTHYDLSSVPPEIRSLYRSINSHVIELGTWRNMQANTCP